MLRLISRVVPRCHPPPPPRHHHQHPPLDVVMWMVRSDHHHITSTHYYYYQKYYYGGGGTRTVSSTSSSLPPLRRSRVTGHVPPSPTNDNDSIAAGSAATTTASSSTNPSSRGVTNPYVFNEAAETLLTKLQIALQPMKEQNEIFIISRTTATTPVHHHDEKDQEDEDEDPSWSTLTIELKPDDGMYRIQVNRNLLRLQLDSPISGRFAYMLCEKTGEWIGDPDGHHFTGLFVRDLIRQCQGLPKL